MTLKYNCPSCNSLLYTAFLKPGDTTICHKCGETITVPENARPSDSLVDIARMAAQKRESMPEGYEPIVETPIDTTQTAVPEPQPRLPNNRYPGFWQAMGLMGLFLLILIALYLPIGIVSAISEIRLYKNPTVVNIMTISAYFIILLIGLKIARLPFKEVYIVKKAKVGLFASIIACSVGVILTIVPPIYWIAVTSGIKSDSMDRLRAIINNPYSMFFSLVIIAPIFEELFFRGLVLRGFLARYSVKKAIIFNAVLFAVMHVHPLRMIAAFFLGLFNAWLRYKTNSITPSIFAHSFNNAIVYFGLLSLSNANLDEMPEKPEFWEPFIVLLMGLTLLFFGYWLIRKQMDKIAAADKVHQSVQTAADNLIQ